MASTRSSYPCSLSTLTSSSPVGSTPGAKVWPDGPLRSMPSTLSLTVWTSAAIPTPTPARTTPTTTSGTTNIAREGLPGRAAGTATSGVEYGTEYGGSGGAGSGTPSGISGAGVTDTTG